MSQSQDESAAVEAWRLPLALVVCMYRGSGAPEASGATGTADGAPCAIGIGRAKEVPAILAR